MDNNKSLKTFFIKLISITLKQAEKFYYIHKDKPFYNDLVNYMISGPVVVQVLQGNNAVNKYRKVMGATNPNNAEEGTIREKFAISVQENSVHGSDSLKSAKAEIGFFFGK